MPESLLPCTARSSTTNGGFSQASLEASPCEHRQDRVTINTLPDDVLVEIFYFHVNHWGIRTNGWHTLVHVCRRWRHVVFASPRRLNLGIKYKGSRPMSDVLDVWPVVPVVIRDPAREVQKSWENVVGALEHHHRIREIRFLSCIPKSQWERLAAAMLKPFPELTYLWLSTRDNAVTSLSDPLLGGSAPLLRHLSVRYCAFPGIPKLLLSANQLVYLHLWDIPRSGGISPQDLGTALSAMSRLEDLRLGFESPLSPESRPLPPLTRSVLPALTRLEFEGVHGYLEDLLAQIEAPLLNKLIVWFDMNLDIVVPQLRRLISQTESFKTCDTAFVYTSVREIDLIILRNTKPSPGLSLQIMGRVLNSQLASLAQICGSSFPPLSTLVQLDILEGAPRQHSEDDMETAQWLELLDPFTAVKDLRLSREVGRHVCQALERLAVERVTDFLPALQNIFFNGLRPSETVPEYIEGFVAARKLSGHPVAIQRWGGI
ncbi:hypothetical protein F5148DRAFT_398767 [Russula earlei]|uniref:Uncharacterized protein n=1 Tax=Russula earlei TaxID=71964 RepID=A0ACC0U0P9_9AGAM|nr:hypothetical protein F5148DRAFT_398767 [Russula earlei]